MTWQFTHTLGSLDRYEAPWAVKKVKMPEPANTPTRMLVRRLNQRRRRVPLTARDSSRDGKRGERLGQQVSAKVSDLSIRNVFQRFRSIAGGTSRDGTGRRPGSDPHGPK